MHFLVIFELDLDWLALEALREQEHEGHAELIELRSLHVDWPQPASLFEVSALHCSRDGVHVGNRFGLYSARMSPRDAVGMAGVSSLTPVARASVGAVLCDFTGDGCQMIRRGGVEANATWEFAPMQPSTNNPSNINVPFPPEWRLVSVVQAEAKRCPGGSGAMCDAVVVAGWKGGEVTIADAIRNTSGTWHMRPRFAVHPRLAPRPLAPRFGPAPGRDPSESYGTVVALQLGSGGRVLTVLLNDGAVDGWDLETGVRVGRWRVVGPAAVSGSRSAVAMCHDGQELWVAHNSANGPVLGLASLPATLSSGPSEVPDEALEVNGQIM